VVQKAAASAGAGSSKSSMGRRTMPAAIGLTMLLTATWPGLLAAGPAEASQPDSYQATTSRQARREAVQSIPLDKLDKQARAKVSLVLSQAGIFRRMPTRVTQCDPELYLFLVRHPDVVVNIWQVLGVTKMKLRQTGPDTFQVADGAGTLSTIRFLYRSYDTHLIYAEGRYDGPLFTKQVRGRALLLLKTRYVREPDGRYYITSRLDSFLHLEPGGVELLTKTFQPLVGKVADNNFIQTAGFLGSLSKTAEVNSRGVQGLAGKLNHVQPEVRKEFAEIALRVAKKAAEQSRRTPPLVAKRPEEKPPR
jgi:hypothetical protein